MKRLSVVIADDSEVCRTLLRDILEAEHDIRVVAEAADGATALQLIEQLKPNLATIDIMMPGMGGLELIERIMAKNPLPILVVTGLPTGPGSDVVFQAVRRGALDVAEKPGGERTRAAVALREQVRLLASVSVVRHVAGLRNSTPARSVSRPKIELPQPPPLAFPRDATRELRPGPATPPHPRSVRVVAIGSSAGGPEALAAVLAPIPKSFPACVAVVQHIPIGFTDPFANFLRQSTELRVVVVRDRTIPTPGTLLIAPDDRHLVAEPSGAFMPSPLPPERGHRPSANVLLSSVARAFGGEAIGLILTGIGDDGANGLLEMRSAGAITIAQDEATSAVYGMPKAARDNGGAAIVLPLPQIGLELVRLTRAPGSTPPRGVFG